MFQFLAIYVRPLLVNDLSEFHTIDYDKEATSSLPSTRRSSTRRPPTRIYFTVRRHAVKINELNGVQILKFAHVPVALLRRNPLPRPTKNQHQEVAQRCGAGPTLQRKVPRAA